jgi:hypothetical protein
LDLNKTVSDIAGTISSVNNREAWVKTLMETVVSKTQGRWNVMVFNMQQSFVFNPPPGAFKFTQATFKGGLGGNITYGVWVFHSATTFQNKGDGGFINWAFYGVWTRNGGTVAFADRTVANPRRPQTAAPKTSPKTSPKKSDPKRR